MWRRGVVVITTAQLHSTKPELRFCAGSNPDRGVSEIRDGEDLWQWSLLEIRLNVFRRSTIPQIQIIIIIIFNHLNKAAHEEFLDLYLKSVFKKILFIKGIGFWHTGILGLWTQELDAGLWRLDSGHWTPDAGLWTLQPGCQTLDSGRWTLDAGCWTLDAEC